MAVFDGYLYAATAQWLAWSTDSHTGLEVWRTNDGINWSQVNTDGFGNRDNMSPWIESFNGQLYVAANGPTTGVQIWRCVQCDGTDWSKVAENFNGNTEATIYYLIEFENYFYTGLSNPPDGSGIWRTANGTDWTRVSIDGFGDSNNGILSGANFKGDLYFGTTNQANGGEIWRYVSQKKIYLPLVVR